MIRRRSLLALLVLGLLVGTLLWLPAAVVSTMLPQSFECGALRGTVWGGQCSELRVRGSRSGSLSWGLGFSMMNPTGMRVELRWTKDNSIAQGILRTRLLSPVALDLNTVSIDLESLRNALPTDVRLGPLSGITGRVDSSGLRLEFAPGRLAALHGEAMLTQIVLLQTGAKIGPFQASFEGKSGAIRDRGGPLGLTATIRIDETGALKSKLRLDPRVEGVFPGLAPGRPVEADVEGRF